MSLLERIKERAVIRFGDPSLHLKIYDEIGDTALHQLLATCITDRGLTRLAFTGVAHIFEYDTNHGILADLQLYGRDNQENPGDIYPLSIVLNSGLELPPELGRACLEETIFFGKEAENYLKLQHKGTKQLPKWLETFLEE